MDRQVIEILKTFNRPLSSNEIQNTLKIQGHLIERAELLILLRKLIVSGEIQRIGKGKLTKFQIPAHAYKISEKDSMSEKNISTSKDSIDTSYLKEQSDRDFFSRLLRLLINGTLIILINGTLIILGLLIAIILIERELLAPSAVELLSLTSGPIIIVWLIVWLIFILWIIRWIIRMIVVAYRNVSIVAPQVIIDTPYLKEESDRDFFSRLRRLFIKWTLIMSLFGLSPIPIAIFMTLFGDRGSAMAVSWLLYITALPTIIVWLIFILWIIIMIVVRYFRKLWR